MNRRIMWEFSTSSFTIVWTVEPCYDLDLSWDDDGSVREGLESGRYVAFDSAVTVYYRGREVASDYLGQSIYEDPSEFRDHIGRNRKGYGSYFSDMVRQAIHAARKELAATPKLRKVS